MLEAGTRVRLKDGVKTMSGWHGCGTVVFHADYGVVKITKDGDPSYLALAVMEHQVEVLPDQTPYGMSPDYVEQLAKEEFPFLAEVVAFPARS